MNSVNIDGDIDDSPKILDGILDDGINSEENYPNIYENDKEIEHNNLTKRQMKIITIPKLIIKWKIIHHLLLVRSNSYI